MRHCIVRLVRSFGTQSDKDFFFHNLAKTGEVNFSTFLCWVFVLMMSMLLFKSLSNEQFSVSHSDCDLISVPGLLAPAHCFSKRGHVHFFFMKALSAHLVTSFQVLILYRDIIRTARIMTHKDNGTTPPPPPPPPPPPQQQQQQQ
jgi:hypothetical protein